MATIVYSDGGCDPNPGPGGWGVVVKGADGDVELCGGEAATTNNRMELMAAIKALEHFPEGEAIHIHSDSQYVIKSMTEWLAGWKRRGWRNSAGEPVKNDDLIRRLDTLASRRSVRWTWVRGHAGNPDNERADRLVAKGRREARSGRPETSETVRAERPADPQEAAPRTASIPFDLGLGLKVATAARSQGMSSQAFVEQAVRDALARLGS